MYKSILFPLPRHMQTLMQRSMICWIHHWNFCCPTWRWRRKMHLGDSGSLFVGFHGRRSPSWLMHNLSALTGVSIGEIYFCHCVLLLPSCVLLREAKVFGIYAPLANTCLLFLDRITTEFWTVRVGFLTKFSDAFVVLPGWCSFFSVNRPRSSAWISCMLFRVKTRYPHSVSRKGIYSR